MVKGNICEKCQKQQATTTYDIKGWKKWTVCDECCKELQTCSKCQKNPATNLITEGKEKKQVCDDCSQNKPNKNQSNLSPEERQQSDYLRNLQQNTLRNAENAYQSRYGSLSEDGSDKGKGMSGGVIALLIGAGIVLIVGIIFLLARNKKKKYE